MGGKVGYTVHNSRSRDKEKRWCNEISKGAERGARRAAFGNQAQHSMDSIRGASVEIGTLQRSKDDTHNNINCVWGHCGGGAGPGWTLSLLIVNTFFRSS